MEAELERRLSHLEDGQTHLEEKVDRRCDEIIGKIEQTYTTKTEFWPVKTVVYWMVGAFASGAFAVLTAVIIGAVTT